MRAQHPVFEAADDPETPIWRYFDFPKFLSLLKEQSLYFCRANLLGDPLEGSFTRAREAERERLLTNPPEGRTWEQLEKIFRHNADLFASMPLCTYVNCWHQGDNESMAMWQGYGGGPYGLAIRSTVGLLDALLPERFGDQPMNDIFIGRVRYVDYASDRERIPAEYNAYAPFVCKSVAYRHESELRALFIDMRFFGNRDAPPGHLVPIDIQSFIQHVTVSPLAPAWFEPLVGSACEHFGLQFPIARSNVFRTPIY